MDQRCRWGYVSSNKGETKVINIKNGVVLKTLFKKRVMKGEDKDSDESYMESMDEEPEKEV